MYMSQYYKIALLGAGGVGKSYLTIRFTNGKFDENAYDPTIEDQYNKSFELDGLALKLEILDTAGQEGFQHLQIMYLQEREAFILVFDISDASTFDTVSNIAESILKHKGKETPLIVVGNKIDLNYNRQITEEQGRSLIGEFIHADYIEASAKLNKNVELIFATLVRKIWARNLANKQEIRRSEIVDEEVQIIIRDSNKGSRKRKQRCCSII